MATNDDSLGIDHMRSFLALVEHGSQASAARSLGISQATVFRHAARVDAHFGGGLFEKGAGSRLSTRGQLVERTLASTVVTLEQARNRLALEQPVLRVGFIRAVRPMIEQTLRTLAATPSAARFDVRLAELQSEHQARKLRRREIDIAVCYALEDLFEDRTGIEELIVSEQPYALVAPEVACRRGKLVVRSLSALHYVHLPSRFKHATADFGSRWLAEQGLKPTSRVECRLATEIIAYAAAGRGYGFLPALWRTAEHRGAVFLPMPGLSKGIEIAAYSLDHLGVWARPFREALLRTARGAARS